MSEPKRELLIFESDDQKSRELAAVIRRHGLERIGASVEVEWYAPTKKEAEDAAKAGAVGYSYSIFVPTTKGNRMVLHPE